MGGEGACAVWSGSDPEAGLSEAEIAQRNGRPASRAAWPLTAQAHQLANFDRDGWNKNATSALRLDVRTSSGVFVPGVPRRHGPLRVGMET